MNTSNRPNFKKTLLGYELTSLQDSYINYLLPSAASYVLYMFLFTCDVVLAYSHYKDNNPIWGALTVLIMYLPVLGSYIIILSTCELWPHPDKWSVSNLVWALVKTAQHIYFPIWSVWRYAERIFWSIEAVRSPDEYSRSEAQSIAFAPRTIELYLFLQAYFHSMPQILFQSQLLLQNEPSNADTVSVVIFSTLLNLAKISATTTYYQRFKSQKLTGKQYPWFKSYKRIWGDSIDGVVIRTGRTFGGENKDLLRNRRSSDAYLEPISTLTENDAQASRDCSVIDCPKRLQLSEPDFNIKRLIYIKGLPDDDLAGKLISFLWWSCFLLARILSISAFAYFYRAGLIWILILHFIIVTSFLYYDVNTDQIDKSHAVFFIFLGLVYIFCIIEFKIRFKKAKFIYFTFFALVFLENFIMCLIWFLNNVQSIEDDFWFRYIFYMVVLGSLASFSSMIFYFIVNEPKKVIVATVIQ